MIAAIDGDWVPEDALRRLLEKSGLAFSVGQGNTIVITTNMRVSASRAIRHSDDPPPAFKCSSNQATTRAAKSIAAGNFRTPWPSSG
jgi:hypothetical protein